ncbi:MAG: hypothetical protein DHS80DRAFT_21668 [Piptocephalis tieghemiana]|nr:MAG: hypothetical protein DHS80DRAFT_21668 [Piptocephalis tieghemiana]
MTNWTLDIPSEPTPKLVHVTDIAKDASEEKVREFFLFCGKIQKFELKDTEKSKEALILFDKESAAKTATMLSNAVINEQQITVQYYFDQFRSASTSTEHNDSANADARESSAGSQEEKPKTGIVTEVVAAGYGLQHSILSHAKEWDAKYGVVDRLQSYYSQALEKANAIDQQYKLRETVTTKAGELDAKFDVSGKVGAATAQMQAAANSALSTGPGQKATTFYSQARDQVNEGLEVGRAKTNSGNDAAPSASS